MNPALRCLLRTPARSGLHQIIVMRHSAKTENHVFSRFSLCFPTFAHKFAPILCVAGRFITRCKTLKSHSLRVWLSVRCALSDASALRFPAGFLRVVCCALRCACRSLRLAHGVLCAALGLHWKQPGGVVGAGLCPRRKAVRGCRIRKQDAPCGAGMPTAGRDRRFAFFTLRGTLPHADAVPPVVSAHSRRAGDGPCVRASYRPPLWLVYILARKLGTLGTTFRGHTSAGFQAHLQRVQIWAFRRLYYLATLEKRIIIMSRTRRSRADRRPRFERYFTPETPFLVY